MIAIETCLSVQSNPNPAAIWRPAGFRPPITVIRLFSYNENL